MDANLCLCEYIIFFAFLTVFLTVCRQELITNSQECIFKASSEQPTGKDSYRPTDRKGSSFLTAWSYRRIPDGEPSGIIFLMAFSPFLTARFLAVRNKLFSGSERIKTEDQWWSSSNDE